VRDRPTVVVIFTGGTISMLPDPVTGQARPALDGPAILARTPGLDAIANVEAIDWGLVPASHLGFPQMLQIATLARAALERREVAGVVVVQGTDVMEETAFAYDLLVDSPKPVVVVGAMRSAGDAGYEGPANLRQAVRVAAAPAMVGQGTVVVMGGAILPADDVVKTHTDAYDTFRAANLGPVGWVTADEVVVGRSRVGRRVLPAVPAAAAEPVFLVTVTVATDGSLVRAAAGLGAAGIVVAATGSGNTDPEVLAAAVEAMSAGIPIVLTTRCPSGRVSPSYGFPGGGAHWIDAGAIPAGFLGGPKARIALALGLGAGLDDAGLRRLFED
jgi:L-asparaginase